MSFLLGPPQTAPRPRALRRLGARALKVAEFLTTPLLPADYGSLIAPLHLSADLRGRLVERRRETADAATLLIRPGRGWRPHVPGQYIRIGVDVDGVRHWRAYSLTSRVGADDGLVAVTVKKIPDGVVSRHLVDEIEPGTLLMLDQAAGDFVLGPRAPRRALFLTAGSGITPVMGMLRNHPELTDVVVVHSAPTADDVVMGAELRALHDSGRIRLVERHTRVEGILDLRPDGASGDESDADAARTLDALVPDWRLRETWACGPTAMLDAAQERWDAAGLGVRLHTERFRPVVAATGDGGVVTFTRSGLDVDADGGAPILDSGEDAGVLMPSGCRMGICFGCVAPLREGSVRDLRTGEVTTASAGNGGGAVPIQTCVSAPAGACSIDL
ncbi:ferredoxin reductase [Agilicoccus flavus]|uniref:ferredoxin reductase n=1 Tax=Agilicoccus flavus TaxID=2775968 RepID=UPI001CF6280E|nr:ferredoxin reductase [Agilicoccus flavus]